MLVFTVVSQLSRTLTSHAWADNFSAGSEHTTTLLSYKAGFGKVDYLEQELLEIDPAQRTDRCARHASPAGLFSHAEAADKANRMKW